ncbi:28S ribosomal protein S6, mitochondrial [Cichlidogyrus casuarinus]|uniref:Small ribosomal subunit protein bS6m n=1 Tax=Cichlidogyrus casuarinus TaxID=1844966 RepID=A0ABD2Q1H1_9PLAT
MAKYEMSLILRKLAEPEMKSALKRHILRLINKQSVVYDVENLGLRRLPNVYHIQREPQYEGHYFLIKFDAPNGVIRNARKEATKDTDIIRCFAALSDDKWTPPCQDPQADVCEFGEIRNPNHEFTNRRRHNYRHY